MAPTLLVSLVMLFALLTTLVAVHQPVPACDDAAHALGAPEVRSIRVSVFPWADVFVDDKLVSRGVRHANIELPIGEHLIVFGNPGAYDERRVVVVPSTGAIAHVDVELRRRPTRMTVHANVPDTDVEVCSHGATDRPIEIPVMESPALVEVRVSRNGFSTVTRTMHVQAGRPVRVDVHLAPDGAR